jgi:3-oxosteroid 1-dehydrogenase
VNAPDTAAWDHAADVVVVGSGNGAMTAALCCHEMGLPDTLVIEKSERYGGTSSISGGGVWIPNNHLAAAAGAQDSVEDARAYLAATLPAHIAAERIDAYLREGPRMMRFLHERTRVRYRSLALYPDYYTDRPGARTGHRSMEPEPIAVSALGEEWRRLRTTHPMMYLQGRIAFTAAEAHVLLTRGHGFWPLVLRLMAQYWLDLPWRLKSPLSRRIACGGAGVARLRLSMLDRDMPLWLNTEITALVADDGGRVIGVEVRREGRPLRIRARRGVVLAAGGFEANQAMREQYLPAPTNAAWSAGCKSNTGDAIRAAMAVGAAVDQMDGAWWCTTFSTPGEALPRLAIMEKSLPGSCVVDRAGERIANESQNYMAYQQALFARHSAQRPCVPAWMVFDARFRRDYLAGPLLTARDLPDHRIPRAWFESGFVTIAPTVAELAAKTGMDAAGLQATLERHNAYAATGRDLEFQRGDSAYDRYYGDARVQPNPCLAPIAEAPFYALRMEPGDFGTHGGLVTDADARVLDGQRRPIGGLYATGNCSAALLPTYPGPGATLGPAMTFAWQAARHLTGWTG